MEALIRAGKIKAWGVSNFDTSDMAGLLKAGGDACATNQILYNITERGPEFTLLPELAQRHIPAMAYSPVGQGDLPKGGALAAVAKRHGVTALSSCAGLGAARPEHHRDPKGGRHPPRRGKPAGRGS